MHHVLTFLSVVVSASCFAGPLQLTLPPMWYGVPGQPMSLYFDNIVLTETPEAYRFEVKCDIGAMQDRCWTVRPVAKDVGDHAMEVTVRDAAGRILEQAKTVFRVAPADAGKDRPLRLLIVGDSLTAATIYPNEIGRLLRLQGNPKLTMIGTHKREGLSQPGVLHEGYGGWKWADFLGKWDPVPAGVTAGPLARRSTSPFLFADARGKGVMNLPRYFKENGGLPPDVVTFLLGINDCFGAPPDKPDAMDKHIDGVLDHAEKLLSAFREAAPEAVLAVGLTTPPNARESGFEANYKGRYHRWGWKRIQHRLVQKMLARFGGREKDNLVLVPTELNLDPVDGYPVNNGVHPNPAGYAQIGMSFYAWLKAWMKH